MSAEHDPVSDEQIRRDFAQLIEQWERGEPAAWIWRARDDGRFIGVGGLQRYGTDGVEIIYAALSSEWEQGFAIEIGTAILDTAFNTMGLPEIVCFVLPTNGASRRIMQKLGFAYDAPRLHTGLPRIFYRLDAATWAQVRLTIDWRTENSTTDTLMK